jgi:hypothetical protein
MPLTSKTHYDMKAFRLTLLFLFMFTATFIFAQRGENIESLHTAFITEKLNLSPEEAQKFWPVYNEYHTQEEALKKQRTEDRDMVKKAGGIDNMSDADIQKLIANETDIQTRELDLRKLYVTKFEQVIPPKKVAKLYIAEEEFKLYLLKQLGNARRGGGMGRREPDYVPQ